MHDIIITEVKNNTLNIYIAGEIKRSKTLKVKVGIKNLNNLLIIGAVNASSDTTISTNKLDVFISGISKLKFNVFTPEFNCEITDAGLAYIQGDADVFDLRVTDEGEIDAFNLNARKASLKVSGYSISRINVQEELSMRVTGAANVYYQGEPEITRRVFSGTGFIIRRKNESE